VGCDIHVFLEKRLRKEDSWQLDENHTVTSEDGDDYKYLEKVNATGRNYHLFGILAGVRSYGKTVIRSPKGIPEDISELLRWEYDRYVDGHSHSWLSLEEFKQCLIEAEYYPTDNKSTKAFFEYSDYSWEERPEDYTTMINYCEEWITNETAEAMLLNRSDINPEVRVVFWFDN